MQSTEKRYRNVSQIIGKFDHLDTIINHGHSGTNKTSPKLSNFSMIRIYGFIHAVFHSSSAILQYGLFMYCILYLL